MMRSPDDVFRDIEGDRAGREGELRLIERYLRDAEDETDQKTLRRSLVLLAYAHLEGFCKFALITYASAINSMRLKCNEASIPLVAASLGDVFAALRNEQKKHDLFRSSLKEDADVHRIAREQSFVESYEGRIGNETVEIHDRIIDTRSNLTSVILKRNLFMLGLPYPFVDQFKGSMDRLLGVRNAIAHGDALLDPKAEMVDEYLNTVMQLMGAVQERILDALVQRVYLRAANDAEAA